MGSVLTSDPGVVALREIGEREDARYRQPVQEKQTQWYRANAKRVRTIGVLLMAGLWTTSRTSSSMPPASLTDGVYSDAVVRVAALTVLLINSSG